MAKYNERFAIGVEDFLRPAQYDRLAAEIDKQGTLNAANQFNSLGRIQSAVMNGEYNVFATKESGQTDVGNATAGMWTDIGVGAAKGVAGFAANGGFDLGGSATPKFGTENIPREAWTEGVGVGGYSPSEILNMPNINW